MFFSLSPSRQTPWQKEQSVSAFDLNRHSEQAERFREKIGLQFYLKLKGFTDTDVSEGLGLFNHLFRVSEGAEMRYYAAVGRKCFR